jgi:hypothetical protein
MRRRLVPGLEDQEGEKWENIKGAVAKERLRQGIEAGLIMGILAYADGSPLGWCTIGPRSSYPRLNRAPTLRCDDADQFWAIPAAAN